MPSSATRHDRGASPLLGVDVSQRLGEHPFVPEGVDEGGLAFAVLVVVRWLLRIGPRTSGSVEHRPQIFDAHHYLMTCADPSLTVSVLAHDHLGALAVHPELRAVTLADPDVLDEPKDVAVPGDGRSNVFDRQHRGEQRPRCGAIPDHG
jgi:hypothetical protein